MCQNLKKSGQNLTFKTAILSVNLRGKSVFLGQAEREKLYLNAHQTYFVVISIFPAFFTENVVKLHVRFVAQCPSTRTDVYRSCNVTLSKLLISYEIGWRTYTWCSWTSLIYWNRQQRAKCPYQKGVCKQRFDFTYKNYRNFAVIFIFYILSIATNTLRLKRQHSILKCIPRENITWTVKFSISSVTPSGNVIFSSVLSPYCLKKA